MREKKIDAVICTGGELCVAHYPGDGPAVLAIHGITSSHMAWPGLIELLPASYDIIAPDLRGRVGSFSLPGPYGLAAHLEDLIAVLNHYGRDEVIVIGHSLGAYIAVALAVEQAKRVKSCVLIDGGIALPRSNYDTSDSDLKTILGPALARLELSFADYEAYHQFWREHPAFLDDDAWDDFLIAYFDYDLNGEPPNMRSTVKGEAVHADARDLRDRSMVTLIDQVMAPMLLLTATRGLLNQPQPLMPVAAVQKKCAAIAHLSWHEIDDTNHYSILLGAGRARVADYIEKFVAS